MEKCLNLALTLTSWPSVEPTITSIQSNFRTLTKNTTQTLHIYLDPVRTIKLLMYIMVHNYSYMQHTLCYGLTPAVTVGLRGLHNKLSQ